MADSESCQEYGTPAYVSGEFLWLESGVMVRRKDTGHRVVSIEREHLDTILSGISGMTTFPVEKVAAGIGKRVTRHKKRRLYGQMGIHQRGKRAAGYGLRNIFTEPVKRPGEGVAGMVAEAEHNCTKSAFLSVGALLGADGFRTRSALRGLGDLVDLKMGVTGLSLGLREATLHLMAAGFAQATYELAFKRESRVDREFGGEGTLLAEVTPRDP